MDLVSLLIYIAVAAIVIIAVYAILQRVTLDPAIRNIITVALIAFVAIVVVILLLKFAGGGTALKVP